MVYEELLGEVFGNGIDSSDRTGTGTLSVFGPQIKYDLSKGFPLITTKKVYWKAVVHELIWFLSGSTNTKYLKDNGISIWDEWEKPGGELGPVYGEQFHRGNQLLETIEQLKKNPNSRRHVMTLWNPEQLHLQALHCCHGTVIQFYVRDNRLSCSMYQRSADMFLGVPFNIASYALLTQMIAHVCGMDLGGLIITFGDCHIYKNHFPQVVEQLSRDTAKYDFPKVTLNPDIKNIMDFKFEDVELIGYKSYPSIKANVSV